MTEFRLRIRPDDWKAISHYMAPTTSEYLDVISDRWLAHLRPILDWLDEQDCETAIYSVLPDEPTHGNPTWVANFNIGRPVIRIADPNAALAFYLTFSDTFDLKRVSDD